MLGRGDDDDRDEQTDSIRQRLAEGTQPPSSTKRRGASPDLLASEIHNFSDAQLDRRIADVVDALKAPQKFEDISLLQEASMLWIQKERRAARRLAAGQSVEDQLRAEVQLHRAAAAKQAEVADAAERRAADAERRRIESETKLTDMLAQQPTKPVEVWVKEVETQAEDARHARDHEAKLKAIEADQRVAKLETDVERVTAERAIVEERLKLANEAKAHADEAAKRYLTELDGERLERREGRKDSTERSKARLALITGLIVAALGGAFAAGQVLMKHRLESAAPAGSGATPR